MDVSGTAPGPHERDDTGNERRGKEASTDHTSPNLSDPVPNSKNRMSPSRPTYAPHIPGRGGKTGGERVRNNALLRPGPGPAALGARGPWTTSNGKLGAPAAPAGARSGERRPEGACGAVGLHSSSSRRRCRIPQATGAAARGRSRHQLGVATEFWERERCDRGRGGANGAHLLSSRRRAS